MRRHRVGFAGQLGKGELRNALDADMQLQPALRPLHLGAIEMEEADGIGLETSPLPAWRLRHRAAARRRSAAGSGATRSCPMGSVTCRLQGQSSSGSRAGRRKAMMIASSSTDRTVDVGSPGAGRPVDHRRPLPPWGDGPRVDAVSLGQRPKALLTNVTMLDRATDRLGRGGARVRNLAHGASLHSCEPSAPIKPGIKQPGSGAVGGEVLASSLGGAASARNRGRPLHLA